MGKYFDYGAYVKEIEGKIREVSSIQEFTKAKEFQQKLEKILKESNLLEDPGTVDMTIKVQLAGLYADIDFYMQQYGDLKKNKLLQDKFAGEVDELVENSEGKETKQLLAELKGMLQQTRERAKGLQNNEGLKDKIDELSAKALLHIFVQQIKENQPIDFSVIKEVSTPEVFVDEVKRKLIEIAEGKDKNTAFDILELCQELKPETLQNKKLWEILENSHEVEFKRQETIEKKQGLGLATTEKLSFFERIKNRFRNTNRATEYTFKILNKKTGEYKTKVEYHNFPPKGRLSKRCENELIAIKIADSVESLKGGNLFGRYRNLKEVELGKNVKEIGEWTFASCENLESVRLPDSLQKIAKCAFFNSLNLERIEGGKNVTEIGIGAFEGCKSLKKIKFPNLQNLRNSSFLGCTNLEEAELGNIPEIGELAFCRCKRLKKINWGEKIQKIGNKAFKGCESLKNLNLPVNVQKIGEEAFAKCKNLGKVELKENVREVGNGVFAGCENLKTVESTTNSIQWLGKDAFSDCPSLEKVVLPAALQETSKSFWGLDEKNVAIEYINPNGKKGNGEEQRQRQKQETIEIEQER